LQVIVTRAALTSREYLPPTNWATRTFRTGKGQTHLYLGALAPKVYGIWVEVTASLPICYSKMYLG